jgi:hypothetical protein
VHAVSRQLRRPPLPVQAVVYEALPAVAVQQEESPVAARRVR